LIRCDQGLDWLLKPMRLPKLYVKKSDKPVPRSYSALNDIFSSPRVTLSFLVPSTFSMRNYLKLSWKSTTCDASPSLPIDRNRTAGGFTTAPIAADLIPKISMNKPSNPFNIAIIPYIIGTATITHLQGSSLFSVEFRMPQRGAAIIARRFIAGKTKMCVVPCRRHG